jgi:Flagellar hook-length control protein FliK
MDIPPIPGVAPGAKVQADSNLGGLLLIGKQYLGSVVEIDALGLASVKIGDQEFSMKLPESYVVGNTVNLRYISADPKPTFLVLKPALPQPQPEKILLSDTGRLITQYLEEGQALAALTPIKVAELSPLMQSVANPALTALQLQSVITMSGLFYESHMAKYLQGKYALNLLRKEPQNTSGFNHAWVVSKQLEALEKQELSWNGVIWPRQYMHWIVRGGSHHSEEAFAEGEPFITTLELDLPRLGKVWISMCVSSKVIDVDIKVASQETRNVMANKIFDLRDALEAISIKVNSITVVHHA